MGKLSRDKGARGEREVKGLAETYGLRAERTANLQANARSTAADVALLDFPNLFIEVKRDERMSVDAMVRQAVADANQSLGVPIVAWRRNSGKWRADVPLDYLFLLLDLAQRAR